jgi:transposase
LEGFARITGMAALSLDLRQRILESYDRGEGTREEIAERFCVSLGMVKKLLRQRRLTGEVGHRHRFSGRKPTILHSHKCQLQSLLARKNDLTLKELREATGLECSLQAIHVVLGKLGLTYKKRRFGLANKTGPTWPRRVERGSGSKAGLTPRNSSSSTNRTPKRT